jgi:hypothetical protein
LTTQAISAYDLPGKGGVEMTGEEQIQVLKIKIINAIEDFEREVGKKVIGIELCQERIRVDEFSGETKFYDTTRDLSIVLK